MRWIATFIIILITALLISPAMALVSRDVMNGLSLDAANKTLDTVSVGIQSSDVIDKNLYTSIQSLKVMQDKARLCAEKGKEELDKIDALLSDKQIGSAIKSNVAEYQYLEKTHKTVASQVASCRVFLFRAEQILVGYADAIQQHKADIVPKNVTPIWAVLSENIISQFSVSPSKIYQDSGIDDLNKGHWLIMAALIGISLMLAGIIFQYFGGILVQDTLNIRMTEHIAIIIRRYIFILLPVLTGSIFLNWELYSISETPTIIRISYSVLLYISALALMDFVLFIPNKKLVGTVEVSKSKRRAIFFRFATVAAVILFGYLGAIFLKGQALTQQFIDIARMSYITLLILAVLRLCWVVFNIKFVAQRKKTAIVILSKMILASSLMSLILIEWFGYHDFSIYVLKGVILSLIFIMVWWGVIMIIDRLFSAVENEEYQFTQMLRHYTNIRTKNEFYEIYTLRIACWIVYVGVFILSMMNIWGASLYQIDIVTNGMIKGFPIFGVYINPAQIAAGLAVFSLISLVGKFVSGHATRQYQFNNAQGSQVAIASIVNYLTFTLAMLVALLVGGVNFTGIAIVAGALSVGIGFGLQNIANNFICGLILLIQKPVKSGDRIVIGTTEGFVTRVRLLSTQIKTVNKEDILVPNADLIFKPLTNFMYRDSLVRIFCTVGVAYGSDIALVKSVLLGLAAKNPDVVQEEANKPLVFFTKFADSALSFELLCVIRDVNKKFAVMSDLNCAIDSEFRKHKIVIAFPQQDIYIKEVPGQHKSPDLS